MSSSLASTRNRNNRSDHLSPSLAPGTDWSNLGKSEHFVQFYDKDSFLLETVGAYIGAGLRQGESAIVIATKAHRDALADILRLDGQDPDKASALGQYFCHDAAETLSKFMVADAPDAALFHQVVGDLVRRATAGGRSLRAFGEMVALLWQEGNGGAAIRLEELWNELLKEQCFSLFCAYPMGGFAGEANGSPFTHICKAHARVIPAESYTANAGVEERLRSITILQQKASSLEIEIARRKEMENALARRERELSDFLQNATEGIHQVAPDGTILWANKAELELLGYSADEYIGRNIRLFHADPKLIADILDRLGRGEELHDYESQLKHKDGSLRYVSINSSVYWEGDRFAYTRCFTRDITARKQASDILEQTVAERTAQLRETVAELEAFSYSISHDMRAPLRAMQGYSKALLEDYQGQFPPEAFHFLERIEASAKRLDTLILDILAYSKIAKGQIELRPIELGPLLEEVIEQHPELQKCRNHISIVQPLPAVLGHEACLSQCLTNVIENALKFVAPGTVPNVVIDSEVLDGKVRVRVSDKGIGIAPEHYDRIFQIFGRVYSEKQYPGTGIGLAIAKKAVTRMGGEIGFTSQVGQGAQFWFTLTATHGR